MAYTFDEIQIGDSRSTSRKVTASDVAAFSRLMGNTAGVSEEEWAEPFSVGEPIVPGVLLLGLVSKVLGCDFPGHGSIAVDLSCQFLCPVSAGSEVNVLVQITDKVDENAHVIVQAEVYAGDRKVLSGDGTVVPPK